MQFTTLPPGLNVRAGPGTTYPKVGTPLPAGTPGTALQFAAYPGSVWFERAPGEWVALVNAGNGPYLVYSTAPAPPPVPVVLLQAIVSVGLYYYDSLNGAGKPIMQQPPVGSRPKFPIGAQIVADPVPVDADGSGDFYRVLNGHMASPATYPPPAGYTGWFVDESKIIIL